MALIPSRVYLQVLKISRIWISWFLAKLSVKSLEQVLRLLLDTIVMNRKYSILRTEVSLVTLDEVRDMDMLRDQ